MANETSSNDGSDVITAKAVAMGVLFLASVILGIIPIIVFQRFKLKTNAKQSIYVQMLLCLGGGVLLGTTFLHLLPEVAEGLEELENFPDINLPWAEFLMCMGFFAIYFIEECVHCYLHRKEKITMKKCSISYITGQTSTTSSQADLVSVTDKYDIEYKHPKQSHSHVVIGNSTINSIRGLLVVLALSIHELFEGLAVGLESSSRNVWYMFGAVSAHKLVISFCIGVELVTSGTKAFMTVIFVFIYSVVTPLGIGIGIAVTKEQESSTAVLSVVLQGLASGTLLYVVFFEILKEERKSGIKQFFSVLVGFLIMLGLTMIDSD